ncbi:hypothetical protein [Sulfuricurvum sp.]|uniref:hypothetical protein n=1 Tax=Sulfuricurvum sp. TaxID=2025608 RepID=UPI003562D8CF
MFNEKIFINNLNEIRYGTTKISSMKTMSEIMELLEKHKCEEILTRNSTQTGTKQIAFVYQGLPYMITIPKVYVGKSKEFNEDIGARLVKYYLEIILDWAKLRVVNLENLLVGQRIVQIDGKNYSMLDVVNKMPPGKMLGAFAEKPPELNG